MAGRAIVYRPRQLVIAPGAYERAAPFPGWTLPGVMTTGAAQTLARAYRVAPGKRVVIAGNGPLNLQLACELVAGGVEVLAVLESAPRPSLRRWREALTAARIRAGPDGERLCATCRSFGAPACRCCGRERSSQPKATAGWNDCAMRRSPRTEVLQVADATTVEADTLCLGYGFIPSTEIARMLGCAHRLVDRHIGYLATETGTDGASSLSGVFVVGDGADLGGSRVALARGTLAGIAAAARLGHADRDPDEQRRAARDLALAERFQPALWSIFRAPPVRLDWIDDDGPAVPLRGDQLRRGPPRSLRRTRHAGGAETQHASRHGPLPGTLLRGNRGAAAGTGSRTAARRRSVTSRRDFRQSRCRPARLRSRNPNGAGISARSRPTSPARRTAPRCPIRRWPSW